MIEIILINILVAGIIYLFDNFPVLEMIGKTYRYKIGTAVVAIVLSWVLLLVFDVPNMIGIVFLGFVITITWAILIGMYDLMKGKDEMRRLMNE